ncbi:MAG: type II toxin-antitoxin system HigB family toxin [Chitinophagaceae bacterium]|nr:MAG: type II toxin-antitoxin system HigB family toxin [Chitinophagaceae bacterium]
MFNIIVRKTLLDYIRIYPEAAIVLQEWYYEILEAEFKYFNELKRVHGSASIVGDDRVVLNIMGNKYRLVVRFVFEFKTVQIKWLGPHSEYDKINAAFIKFKKRRS